MVTLPLQATGTRLGYRWAGAGFMVTSPLQATGTCLGYRTARQTARCSPNTTEMIVSIPKLCLRLYPGDIPKGSQSPWLPPAPPGLRPLRSQAQSGCVTPDEAQARARQLWSEAGPVNPPKMLTDHSPGPKQRLRAPSCL